MSKQVSRWVKLLAQLLLSACLLAFAFHKIDFSQVSSLSRNTLALSYLPVAVLLFNLSKVASAFRLNLYQRHAGILLGEKENLMLYYAGMFLNLLLPGGIGGDGYKVLVLHKSHAAPVKTLLWITLFDRISGMLALLLLACLLMPFVGLPPAPYAAVTHIGWLAVLGSAAVAGAMLFSHYLLLKMRGRPAAMACAYALMVQLLQLGCMAAILACFGISVTHYVDYLAVFLVSSLAAALPLSFGGVGAREVTFLYGLQFLNIEPTQGVLASSAFFLITAISSLVGALFLKNITSLGKSQPDKPLVKQTG